MTNPYNKLGSETSPYLQQHADNPVNWYPWGEEALNLARAQNKPILLSIGYSACHWCHVMAHESFEDETTAALMNEYFINIKVDREERPDLDKIYQLAHQMLAGRGGGWPLTMFLTPEDQTPFFGGTYFPPVRRHGLRSFSEILTALHQAYVNRQEDIQQQNASLREQLKAVASAPGKTVDLDDLPIQTLTRQLLEQYDAVQGGFTPKPKFPHPFSIERTFRQRYLYGEQHQALLEAGLHTARKMAQGGLFDHIGGGFCRYSTDEYWMIPHFEKMLYDNGQLLTLYAWAYQIDPDYYFDCAIRQTATWLMREMQSPEGGYYSAQDADSEGEEGKYYVWTAEQIADALDDTESQLFTQSFGLNLKSNFEGKWYPHTYKDIRQIASDYGQQEHEVQQTLNRSKRKLYDVRSQRIAPATDEKILTSWNALMIRGMNTAARIIDEPDYAESARQALRFIHKTLWVNNRLLATYKDNKAHLNAYLDDYAYLLLAIIDALQNEWDTKLYAWSKEVANSLLELFEDKDYGGFYFTSHDHEQLILRNKSFSDDAMPSGNGIASTALQYLGLLSGQTIYLDSAEKALLATAADLKRYPLLYCALLNALDSQLHSATIIILRGQLPAMKVWQAEVYQHYLPDILCFPIDRNIELPAELDDKKPLEADVCAYICEGLSCREPITRLDEFKLFIKHKRVDPIKPQDK